MSPLFESLGWFAGAEWLPWLLDLSLKAALLLTIAFVITGLARGASASVRHHVWTLAFAAVLALPLLHAALPSWQLPVPGWRAGGDAVAGELTVSTVPDRAGRSGGVVVRAENGARISGRSARIDVERVTVTGASSMTAGGETGGPGWTGILLITWAAGVLLLLLRLGAGVATAWRTARAARPIEDPAWTAAVGELRAELGVESPVRVLRSERVRTPMAWGIFAPVLLLPNEALEWSPARRRAVLLHELAHVRRRDCLVHLVAQAARALHWVNPLAWIGARRLRAERERACDDMVLDAGTRSADYAKLLLDVARARGDRRLAWATVSMARPSELEGRLLAILDPARDRRRPGPLVWVGSLALMVGLTASLAALQAAPSAPTPPEPPLAPEPLAAGVAPSVQDGRSPSAPSVVAPAPRPPAEAPGVGPEGDVPVPAFGRSRPPPSIGEDWLPRVLEAGPPPAMADTVDERVMAAMLRALSSERASVREQAAHTLGMIESSQAVDALSSVLRSDPEAAVRSEAAWALGMIEDAGGVPALTAAVRDASAGVRSQAVWALGMIESADGVPPLLEALDDDSAETRSQAAWALGMIESSTAVDGLIRVLSSDDSAGVREQAAWALGMIEDDAALDALIDALEDESDAVAEQAMWALGMIIG